MMNIYRIKNRARRILSFLIMSGFIALQLLPFLPLTVQNTPLVSTLKKASLFQPFEIEAAGLSSASATLANPRLSFDAISNGTIAIGEAIGVTQASGAGSDWDTRNLFPRDNLLITGNAAIPVASVSSDLVTFILTSPLTSGATAGVTHMTVAQSGALTVRFTTASSIPTGGSVKILIPAPASGGNDGVPLAAATLAANGFDTNGMPAAAAANIGCPSGFDSPVVTTGVGTPHIVTCDNAGPIVLAGANMTITIGTGANPLVNPAPAAQRTLGQRGVADIYTITASTYSGAAGGGSLIEDIRMKIAPVEGVLVSASVDETLSFTVAGLGSGTYCGVASTVTTTATSVPWGTLSSTYAVGTNNAAQLLTVSTNASSGYTVYAEENDQMGKDGNVCTGLTPSAEPYTYSTGGRCIRDYNKGGASHTTSSDWTTAPGTDYGFGYSLESVAGSVRFNYGGGAVWNTKHFADQEGGNDKYAANADLMYSTSPADNDSARVCYRIHIPGTQPAGYYYNKIKYTAVPKF